MVALSFAASASDRFYKPTDKITFTYEEFRSLSPQNQEAWLKELRNFNRNVDLILNDQRLTAKKPKFWSFLESLQTKPLPAGLCLITRKLAGFSEAQAQNNAECTMRKKMFQGQEEICLSCPGDLISGRVDECVPNNGKPDTISFNLMAKIHQKGNPNAKLYMDMKKLSEMAQKTLETGTSNFEARKETVTESPARKAAQPVDLTPLPKDQAEKLLEMRGEPTDYEKIQNEIMIRKIEEAGKKKESELKPISAEGLKLQKKTPRSLQDLGDRGSNDDLDKDEITKTDRLACIYAGWAVQAEKKCSPVTEKTIADANGKKVKYSCKPAQEGDDSTVYGGNEEGDAIVLCNPVVFGLIENKPICIKRAANATENCAAAAGPAAETLAITKQNPEEYRALTRRISHLCQSDESKLRAHFEKRGKTPSQVTNAIKDLSTTCTHLRGRMAQLEEAHKGGSSAAGTR